MLKMRIFATAQNDKKGAKSLRGTKWSLRKQGSNLTPSTVIARRSRSNLIFTFLPRISRIISNITNFKFNLILPTAYCLLPTFLLSTCYLLLATPLYAQQTYNLEIIFKTGCPLDSMETFGISLSSAGDVNNDGFEDIIIGSKTVVWAGAQDTSPGHAYIYLGSLTTDTIVDISLPGEHPLDLFGYSVAGLGDINCDSFDDVAVGAPNYSLDSCGRVYVYFGGDSMDSIPDLVLKGSFCAAFGCGIASGDVNGDSWNDIIVGEYWWGNGNGRVYVYYGGPLLDTIPDVIINGHNGESMGITVGSGGDVNSDGFEDIVAGAFNNDEAGTWAGKVYVFLGGNPMDTVPDCWLHGEGATQSLGWFNVDAIRNISFYDRTLTGTELWPNGFMSVNNGKIYILNGGSPPDTIVDVWMVGRDDSSFLGVWSTAVNKVNNDNYGEVLSGAPGDPPDPYGLGMGYLWAGANLMDTIPDAWLKGRYYGDQVGCRVASAGDVNGDSFDEVMFSNYAADSNQTVWVCRYVPGGIQDTQYKIQDRRIEIFPTICRDGFWILDAGYWITDRKLQIKVYDVLGKEVIFYESKKEGAGSKKYKEKMMQIDTRSLPSGVYFIKVEAGDLSVIKKVVKVK